MSTQISVRLDVRLWRKLRSEARRRGMQQSDLIRKALAAFLELEQPGEPERPLDRVRDLIGKLSGGPRDLAAEHRRHLREIMGDRR